jgi:uroporphyrinogen decarboxylase
MDGGEEGMGMTPRERLLTTLAHKEPDRVPLTAKLWADTLLKLRKHFGLTTNEELFEKMGIDNGVVNVNSLPPRDWKPTLEYAEFCKTIGFEVRSQHAAYEEWGIRRKLGAKGQSIVQQFFFSYHPWESFTKPSQIEAIRLPDLDTPGRLDEAQKTFQMKKDTHVIVGALGHVLWTRAWELRGMLRLMKDLHTDPQMAESILDKLLSYNCDLADRFLDMGCDGIAVSEDWGNNYSLFISPALWRKYFKQRYMTLFDMAKKRGKLVFFHSDGNITPIVGDLVEIGIDSLNPVQPECMDQIEVKQKYGDKITIDTGVSNQKTLPLGTPEDVRNETMNALRFLAPGGGFVYGTSHYAMYDVPVENVITLYETCKRYGKYPIQLRE